MRVPSSTRRQDISENMMTSMIDVVFLLLIFFVCAAAGAVYELLLPTDLSKSGGTGTKATAEPATSVDEVWIYLSVSPGGETLMVLNGTEYQAFGDLRLVLLSLADVAPESPVILDIAPDVKAGEMVKVYDTCRAAGFRSINFNAGTSSDLARPGRPGRKSSEPDPNYSGEN
jgi:biopolymer transport protein ExbD